MKLNMENKFYRVIVCGTNFGRIYIEGITRKTTKCKLVGILSKGVNNLESVQKVMAFHYIQMFHK